MQAGTSWVPFRLAESKVRPMDAVLLDRLSAAGVIPFFEGDRPVPVSRAAVVLLESMRSNGQRDVFYLLCRILSEPLWSAARARLVEEALPMDPDAVVSETLARIPDLMDERLGALKWAEEADFTPALEELLEDVVREAIAGIDAFVPGMALTPLWDARRCQAALGRWIAPASTPDDAPLSASELDVVVAQVLLDLGRRDRHVLLAEGPASRRAPLELGAARRRLAEGVRDRIRWFRIVRGAASSQPNGGQPR